MAPLNYRVIAVPLGGGVDLKRDSKTVAPDKSLTLENALLAQIDTAQKRHGYDGLSKTVLDSAGGRVVYAGQTLAALEDELLLVANQKDASADLADGYQLLSRAYNGAQWVRTGPLESASVRQAHVMPGFTDHKRQTVAADSKYICYAVFRDTPNVTRVTVVDRITGSRVIDYASASSVNFALNSRPRLVAVGGVFLMFGGNTTNIERYVITPSTGVISSATNDVTDHNNSANTPGFDVDALNATEWVLAYKTTPGNALKVIKGDKDGNVSSLATLAVTPKNAIAIKVANDPAGNKRILVAYQDNGTGDVNYYVLQTDGTVVTGPSTVDDTDAAETVEELSISDEPAGATGANASFRAWWLVASPGSGDDQYIHTRRALWATGGSHGSVYKLRNVVPVSRAFTVNGRSHLMAFYSAFGANLQPTYFVKAIQTVDGNADDATVAKAIETRAGAAPGAGNNVQSQVADLGGGKFLVAALRQDRDNDPISGAPAVSVIGLTFDFSPAQLASATIGGLSIGGGVVVGYDGRTQELGFHLFPEGLAASSTATTGGSMSNGTYLNRVIWEWTDRRGQVHRSEPCVALSQALSGGGSTQKYTLTIPTLKETEYYKARSLKAVLYSTATTGTTYYRTSETVNDKTADTISLTRTEADSTLTDNEQLYTNGGVLPDSGPPSSDVCVAGKGRLWLVPADDAELIWFSKYRLAGEPARFSATLVKRVSSGGPIVNIGVWSEAVIVFQERSVRYFTGSGPNDLGQPAGDLGFSEDFLLSLDVGCKDRPSLVAFDRGLMFKSHRGFYITTGGPPQYVGADVEAYNAYTVTSAVLVEAAHQVRFGLDAGPTLVYDYLVGQWSTFTNHASKSATLWRGKYAWVDSGGLVHVESDGYMDAGDVPISLKWGTGWIRLSGLQGFQSCTRAYILGAFKSHHKLKLSVYVEADGYDPTEAVETAILDTREALAQGTGLYKFEHALAVQKCSAVRFEIEDLEPAGSGEGYSISGLALKVGLLPGVHRGGSARVF